MNEQCLCARCGQSRYNHPNKECTMFTEKSNAEMIMVHLNHPCFEIDIWETKTDEEKTIALQQGYVALKDIRNVMYVPNPYDSTVNVSYGVCRWCNQLHPPNERCPDTTVLKGFEMEEELYESLKNLWSMFPPELPNTKTGSLLYRAEMVIARYEAAQAYKANRWKKLTLNIIDAVIELKEKHRETWRDMPESYWLAKLMQEVGELGSSLVGDHDDSVEWELMQISTICLNWLEMRDPQVLPTKRTGLVK